MEPPSILYIEDDESLSHLVKRRIGKHGYQVDVALDCKAAFEQIEQHGFDLLIVDYQLSDGTGIELLTQLKEKGFSIPSIMVSGQENIRIAVEALTVGCLDYLIKDGHGYLELLPLHIKSVLERVQLSAQKQYAEAETAKAKQSLSRAQKMARMGNWEWYANEPMAWWSDEHYEIFGLEKQPDKFGISFDEYKKCVHPNDLEKVDMMFETLVNSHNEIQNIDFEYRICLPDQSVRWLYAINSAEFDDQGQLLHIQGTIQDITERKESESQLLLSKRVFDSTNEAIMVANADKEIISINPAFTRITGYECEEVLGEQVSLLKSGKHDDHFYDDMWLQLEEKGFWSGELWNRNKAGEIYPEWLSITVLSNDLGEVDQYVAIFSDISQHKKAEQIIEYQANYDALTDLPNRNLFNDRLKNAIKLAERDSSKVALIFLDLDRFKWVNDTLGHRAGDMLLQEAAKRLSVTVRESDSVARMGGDEFTVVLNHLIDGVDAEIIAEKILTNLSKPYLLEGREVFISASIGITVYPDDATDIETLFRNADTAMYVAKEHGRNRFSFFTAEMQQEAERRLQLLNEMQLAIKNEDFALHYQPIIETKTGKLYGAEALLRWPHRDKGFIPPDAFIPLAEETGLIQPLGDWIIRESIQQLKNWQTAGHDVYISINKSSKQFHSSSCADDLHQQIDLLGVDPSKLGIEITETVLMEQRKLLSTLLKSYRDIGIKISLDDFGTGYSSLNYLRQFPFDVLKIDRSFIQDVTTNEDNATLVETIILMGHNLGLSVLAEGVETIEQKQFLENYGCDLMQGYLFSPAVPAPDFERQFLA